MCALQLHGFVPPQTLKQEIEHCHELLSCGPISALVSHTSASKKAEDLSPEDLADWAFKHNAILTAYCAGTTVVPMAIGAVFSGKAAVVAALEAEIEAHVAKLDALDGIQEYTVQLTLDTPAEPARLTPTSGRHFLQLQRNRRDGRHKLQKDRQQLAQHVLDRLQTPTLQIEAAGAPKPDKLLNCVVLIRRFDLHCLQHLARDLHDTAQGLGLELVITGPWPPYSSAALKTPLPKVYDVART